MPLSSLCHFFTNHQPFPPTFYFHWCYHLLFISFYFLEAYVTNMKFTSRRKELSHILSV